MMKRISGYLGTGGIPVAASLVLLSVCALSTALPATAAEPVALLVGVKQGEMKPGLPEFSEIEDGTELVLDPGARVTFLHYQRCEEVTVESGHLTLRAGTYRIVGGDIVERTAKRCPKTGQPAAAQDVGGVLFRGQDVLKISPSAALIITGPGAGEVVSVRVTGTGSGKFETVELSDNVIHMRSFAEGMLEGDEHLLELLTGSGSTALRMVVISSLTHSDLAVIRVE